MLDVSSRHPMVFLGFFTKVLQQSAVPWAQQSRGGATWWNTGHVSGTDGHLGRKHDVVTCLKMHVCYINNTWHDKDRHCCSLLFPLGGDSRVHFFSVNDGQRWLALCDGRRVRDCYAGKISGGGMSGCKTKQLPEKLNGMDMLDMWQHKFVSFNCFWLVACRHFEICQDQGVLAATSRSRWAGMLMNVDIWIWNWSSIPTKHCTLQVVDVEACRIVKSVGVSTQWFAFEVFLWLGYFSISQLHKDCKQHVFWSLFRRTHWVLIETCSIRGTMMHLDMPVCLLKTFRSKECSPHSLQHLPGYAAKQLWADSALVATSPRHI